MKLASFCMTYSLDQIHSAGTNWAEPFETYPDSAWDKLFALNVKAVFHLTRACVNLLKSVSVLLVFLCFLYEAFTNIFLTLFSVLYFFNRILMNVIHSGCNR
jgi:NAD(P)-dependent dehydrogenase (short-subunit alcohol dehydrogenase family)